MTKILAAFIAGALFASHAAAAPHAQTPEECGVAADMALVADALAATAIERGQAAKVMALVYDVAASDRGREMMKQIIDAAYQRTRAAASGSAVQAEQKFAVQLYRACMASDGDMDEILERGMTEAPRPTPRS